MSQSREHAASTGQYVMTLCLLLVTTAAVMPIAAIAIEASRLGIVGTLVGACVAVVIDVVQIAGHYKLSGLLEKLDAGWRAELLVCTWYVAILVEGALCAGLTLFIARLAA